MTEARDSPRAYGLSHESWRTNQFESVQWALAMADNNDFLKHDVGITQQVVGSGKTGFARALASRYSVVALCRTKNLQSTVYAQYGFDVLFGRGSYPCVHEYAEEGDTCDTCLYDHEGMDKCPYAHECLYIQAKRRAKSNGRASLNYSYYLTAQWPKDNPRVYLVCDETHLISDIVLGWVGCQLGAKDVRDWNLSSPPVIDYSEGMSLFHTHDPCQQAVIYLRECINSINRQLASLSKHLKSQYNGPTVKKRIAHGQNLLRSILATVQAIQTNAAEWYIRSGSGVIKGRNGPETGFLAKPLTARYHFGSLFLHSPITILMSGTIGNVETFATELGLKDYQFRSVPSNFPPEVRPIQVLDVPHLNYKSGEKEYGQQADAIAKAILECPKDWSGIIHVTRKREGPLLAERLAHRGLQDRVYVTPEGSTDAQMAAWTERKKECNGKYGGQLVISWSMFEGVDLLDERICISAKVPYPDTSDPYEKARQAYSNSFYSQRSAWSLAQSLARTRRGFREDYDFDGKKEQLVAIADGSWTRLRKYLDQDFLDSIRER